MKIYNYIFKNTIQSQSRDLRKESLYVKFDPFVSDSPRRRTNIGRPSDIIDFSDNRKSMIKQRLISLNSDLSAETKPEIQPEPRCLLDMNSFEDVDSQLFFYYYLKLNICLLIVNVCCLLCLLE